MSITMFPPEITMPPKETLSDICLVLDAEYVSTPATDLLLPALLSLAGEEVTPEKLVETLSHKIDQLRQNGATTRLLSVFSAATIPKVLEAISASVADDGFRAEVLAAWEEKMKHD